MGLQHQRQWCDVLPAPDHAVVQTGSHLLLAVPLVEGCRPGLPHFRQVEIHRTEALGPERFRAEPPQGALDSGGHLDVLACRSHFSLQFFVAQPKSNRSAVRQWSVGVRGADQRETVAGDCPIPLSGGDSYRRIDDESADVVTGVIVLNGVGHHQVDANNDGIVTREEAQSFPRLSADFDTADTNKDGKLDKVEFKATIPAEMAANVDDARLGMMFDRRDADKDGNLTKAEFTAPMQRPQ